MCANLPWHRNANITWLLVIGLKNSGIVWCLSSWISTSLKSSTRLLIDLWLRQMPPHSGNRSRLSYSWLAPVAEDFVCAPASQALCGAYFFCVMHSVYWPTQIAYSSHLKCAPLKLNQKVSVC